MKDRQSVWKKFYPPTPPLQKLGLLNLIIQSFSQSVRLVVQKNSIRYIIGHSTWTEIRRKESTLRYLKSVVLLKGVSSSEYKSRSGQSQLQSAG